MNKADAIAELVQIEKHAAELRAIIDAPSGDSLLNKPEMGSGDRYWSLSSNWADKRESSLEPYSLIAMSDEPRAYRGGNIFTDKNTANAYADAIDTMLLLRHQPGSCAPSKGTVNYDIGISYDVSNSYLISAKYWTGGGSKMDRISPCFQDRAAAEAAIKAIGSDKLIRMFKTFHHVTD